jgi:hypothetical protein
VERALDGVLGPLCSAVDAACAAVIEIAERNLATGRPWSSSSRSSPSQGSVTAPLGAGVLGFGKRDKGGIDHGIIGRPVCA